MLYSLYIQFASTIGWLIMAKVLYGFRFDPSLHSSFKAVATSSGCTVTCALERFMQSCVDANSLVYAEGEALDFEVEARVLVDWLSKGKCFFRDQNGEEVNVQGKLMWLLPRVKDGVLKGEIEGALKKSVR